MVAFLAVELGVLPSQILSEDYNLIGNVISVIQAKSKLQERQHKKLKN